MADVCPAGASARRNFRIRWSMLRPSKTRKSLIPLSTFSFAKGLSLSKSSINICPKTRPLAGMPFSCVGTIRICRKRARPYIPKRRRKPWCGSRRCSYKCARWRALKTLWAASSFSLIASRPIKRISSFSRNYSPCRFWPLLITAFPRGNRLRSSQNIRQFLLRKCASSPLGIISISLADRTRLKPMTAIFKISLMSSCVTALSMRRKKSTQPRMSGVTGTSKAAMRSAQSIQIAARSAC